MNFLNIIDGEDKTSLLKNCIRNNYRHLRKWAKRTQTNCFRVYDKDIKEFPIAIDYYDGRFCIHFFASTREMPDPSQELQDETEQALNSLFGEDVTRVWRSRIKRLKTQQYEKIGQDQQYFVVQEHGVKFYVNLNDYLDTGLFLDHRLTRQMVAGLCKGKNLLNLFAYTGSFSVHAAIQGAKSTKSVDMSNTYTDWSVDNFKLNGLSLDNNEILRADCLKFLEQEMLTGTRYDVIVIDPPTVSRSKKMDEMFDIQKDYVDILLQSLELLSPEGSLLFSTNSRRFVFDQDHFFDYKVEDISSQTIPLDFRSRKIHRCWKITPVQKMALK
ncbi:MAG: class I SAM-dependent methyltransferase [Parachlamydiales bacterium]|nr:class I SAM-dependent methyltransferase [Parachlamydiales bacterium]